MANSVLDDFRGVYRDPFHRRTLYPKIPDGKMETSMGMQQRFIKDLIIAPDADLFDGFAVYYVVVIPSLDTPLRVFRRRINGGTMDDMDQEFSQKSVNSVFQYNGALNVMENRPAEWRMVSQGLRILPVDQTDSPGYFESFSTVVPLDEGDVLDPVTFVPGLPARLVRDAERNLEAQRMTPTYYYGDMNTLQKLSFRQLVNDTQHTPKRIKSAYPQATLKDNLDFFKDITDNSFLMRFIRIRAPRGARFVLDISTNYEFCSPASSPLYQLQTVNDQAVPIPPENNRNEAAEANVYIEGVANVTPNAGPPEPEAPTPAAQRALFEQIKEGAQVMAQLITDRRLEREAAKEMIAEYDRGHSRDAIENVVAGEPKYKRRKGRPKEDV